MNEEQPGRSSNSIARRSVPRWLLRFQQSIRGGRTKKLRGSRFYLGAGREGRRCPPAVVMTRSIGSIAAAPRRPLPTNPDGSPMVEVWFCPGSLWIPARAAPASRRRSPGPAERGLSYGCSTVGEPAKEFRRYRSSSSWLNRFSHVWGAITRRGCRTAAAVGACRAEIRKSRGASLPR